MTKVRFILNGVQYVGVASGSQESNRGVCLLKLSLVSAAQS